MSAFEIELLPHSALLGLREKLKDLLAPDSDEHVQTVGLRLLHEIEHCITTDCPEMFFLVAVGAPGTLGISNGTLLSPETGLSYHTLLLPGGHHCGCGAALFREKCRHLFALGVKRIYACPESPNGVRLCEAFGFRRCTTDGSPVLLPWETQRYTLTAAEFAAAQQTVRHGS